MHGHSVHSPGTYLKDPPQHPTSLVTWSSRLSQQVPPTHLGLVSAGHAGLPPRENHARRGHGTAGPCAWLSAAACPSAWPFALLAAADAAEGEVGIAEELAEGERPEEGDGDAEEAAEAAEGGAKRVGGREDRSHTATRMSSSLGRASMSGGSRCSELKDACSLTSELSAPKPAGEGQAERMHVARACMAGMELHLLATQPPPHPCFTQPARPCAVRIVDARASNLRYPHPAAAP